MPSTSELSPIASQHGTSSASGEPVRVGIQPFDILKRNAKIAAIAALSVATLGGLAVHSRMKPLYEASSIVYVSPIFPNALDSDHDHDRQYEYFLEQQITAATRYETLQKAVEGLPPTPGRASIPTESEQSLVTRLQKALKVEQVGRSYEVSITLESPEKDHIADFVNQITATTTSRTPATKRSTDATRSSQRSCRKRQTCKSSSTTPSASRTSSCTDVGMAHFDGGSGANPYDDTLVRLLRAACRKRARRAPKQRRSCGPWARVAS